MVHTLQPSEPFRTVKRCRVVEKGGEEALGRHIPRLLLVVVLEMTLNAGVALQRPSASEKSLVVLEVLAGLQELQESEFLMLPF